MQKLPQETRDASCDYAKSTEDTQLDTTYSWKAFAAIASKIFLKMWRAFEVSAYFFGKRMPMDYMKQRRKILITTDCR